MIEVVIQLVQFPALLKSRLLRHDLKDEEEDRSVSTESEEEILKTTRL